MSSHLTQAFSDLDGFLSGFKAPALVSHSLATVVAQNQATVADAVVRWAFAHPDPDRLVALVACRNKIFDIFFYRIVRFRRIYDFFDQFEEALVEKVPAADRPRLARMLAAAPWREIRPIGSFNAPQELALENRREVSAQCARFNDDLYKNATHLVLSAEKRYTFEDERTRNLVGHYQTKLAGLFDDFVTLIQDPQQKREILLANRADEHAVYQTKSRFEIENFVCHLMEFVIALLNDEFFEHGIQVLGIIKQIHTDFGLDAQKVHWKRFRAQSALIDRQKLAEYSSARTRAILLRSVLPLFEGWTAPQLLEVVMTEEDRRARRFALTLLEAYGREVYPIVVERLAASTSSTPWYQTRNLAYLLGRVVTSEDALRTRAVVGLAPHLKPGGMRQVNLQVVAALGFIGTDQAASVLAARLGDFASRSGDREAGEVCDKIVSALLAIGTPRTLEAAVDYCMDAGLAAEHREELARVTLPPGVRARLVARVRREARKLRLTHSLLGNTSSAVAALGALGHSGGEDVEALCRDLGGAFPADHELGAEARRVLETPPPPAPLAADRALNALLVRKDVPQAFCHVYEAGASGRLELETRDGGSGEVDFWQGEATAATVPGYGVENEHAFYWAFMLDPREIARLRFTPAHRPPAARHVEQPTADLLRDGLFQRAEVQQIAEGTVSPESRFRRREVHPVYRDFSRLPEPQKYEAVWEAIAEEVDIKTIRSRTRLSRHEIYKILLHFHRRNMVATDASKTDVKTATITDALATIDLYLRRIREHPVAFRSYHAAANGCAYLGRNAADDAMKAAARALGAYLLDAFGHHRPFVGENVDVCKQTVDLMARFHASRDAADRQALADYVSFAFVAVSVTASQAKIAARSTLEKIENIESGNDPYDPTPHAVDGEEADDLVAAIEHTLAHSGVSVSELAAGAEPTEAEARVLLEVFQNVAALHAKPIKDFARELEQARAAGAPTSSGWLEAVVPSLRLMSRVASATHHRKVESIVGRVARAVEAQQERGGRELPTSLCELVLAECRRLADLAPLAFGTVLSDDLLARRRDALLARLILAQIDGVGPRELSRLAVAGLTTVHDFLEVTPDEVSVSAGIDPALAERVFLKFYQYQDLHGRRDAPETREKFVAMFDIGLTLLKETHAEAERLAGARDSGEAGRARSEAVVAGRQRTLASLLALLCLKDRYDMVEALQVAPFEERLRLLDGYFVGLASPPAANAAA